MATTPAFRLLGFPVTVGTGFVLGMLLLLGLNLQDPAAGVAFVAAVAAFTVIHELGHASAARRFGADAAISLDFLVGYAMYRSRTPLMRWQHVVISASGPLVQIGLGVAVLF